MQLALHNCTIEGVSTSIAIHAEIMRDEAFKAGGVTTSFLPAFLSRTHDAFSRKVDQT
jgi:biotin carboxylase